MPQLGQRLGHLDRQPVQEQIVLVPVRREQLLLALTGLVADRYDVEAGVVLVARVDGAEEVGDAEVPVLLLARKPEPQPLGGAVVVGPDDEVVAVGVHGEVPPGDGRDEQAFRLGPVELVAQSSPDPVLELGVCLG